MEGESIEIVRRGLRRFMAGEDQSLDDMDPEFTLDNSDGVIAPGVYRGLAGVREHRRAMEGPWREIRFEALEYLATADDLVVVPMRRVRGRRHPALGRRPVTGYAPPVAAVCSIGWGSPVRSRPLRTI